MNSFSRVYGLETVTIRYFNVFGPYQDPTSQYSGVLAKFIPQMLRGEAPTIHGDGEQSRDFTFIENVVNGNLLAAHAPAEKVSGKVFNVATGNRITLNETRLAIAQDHRLPRAGALRNRACGRREALAGRHFGRAHQSRLRTDSFLRGRTAPNRSLVQRDARERSRTPGFLINVLLGVCVFLRGKDVVCPTLDSRGRLGHGSLAERKLLIFRAMSD
jgi:hypothetical protein